MSDALALNAICPYYTMFPISFPQRVLRNARKDHWVLDPFCGRGTTLFAARLQGLSAVGIDSNPVAAAIAEAKIANTTYAAVIRELLTILKSGTAQQIPEGRFWCAAFHPNTLERICLLREALMADSASPARRVLRAVFLGALHGPRNKTEPSYLSNQAPRTFAPKPKYSVAFWKQRHMNPPEIDPASVIGKRAERALAAPLPIGRGHAILADSRDACTLGNRRRFEWVITSPPYYGMRTYNSDQWLRNWAVGGAPNPVYCDPSQLSHTSVQDFRSELSAVWSNAARACRRGAKLVVRFGSINERDIDPLPVIKKSITNAGWRIQTIKQAGTAHDGHRQARQFSVAGKAKSEYDVYAVLDD